MEFEFRLMAQALLLKHGESIQKEVHHEKSHHFNLTHRRFWSHRRIRPCGWHIDTGGISASSDSNLVNPTADSPSSSVG